MGRPSPVARLFLSLALHFVTVTTACCVDLYVVLLDGPDIGLLGLLVFGLGLAIPFFLGHAVVVALCWRTVKMSGRGLYVLSVVAGGASVGAAYVALRHIAPLPCLAWPPVAPALSALVSLTVVVLPAPFVRAIKGRRKTSGPSADGPLGEP